MGRLRVFGVVSLAMALGSLLPATADPAQLAERTTWIVQLRALPLASHPATSPRLSGRPLDLSTPEARSYVAHLDEMGERALAAAGARAAPVFYRYHTTLPGFAARLTAAEADRLRASPEVRSVTPDGVSHLQASGPAAGAVTSGDAVDFLGLPAGLWKRLGGPDHAGEGVIIGVIDTGIHPEHPSFADSPPYPPPKDWKGTCQAGEAFPASTCKHKLIGARFFVAGSGPDKVSQQEFLSPRDADGHGSHVAATAAGNFGVHPSIAGNSFGFASVSGIAPRAYLAAYKVCWVGRKDPGHEVEDFCNDSDTVAAIDAAVGDGVDVINYSVGSTTGSANGPVETALLHATDAGVFVATAAGNNGPRPETVGPPAAVPWLTSVAASTLARRFEATATVVGGEGRPAGGSLSVSGASLTGALAQVPLVDAAATPAPGVGRDRSELCLPGSLDATAVRGKAVLCLRGGGARVDKGKVVGEAGGAGMIIYNATDTEGLSADAHVVPAVHVTRHDGLAVKQLLAGAGRPEVSITAARAGPGPGDVVASFSSRGPQAAVPDIPKPDLAAPGVDILAAATPTPAGKGHPGETFQILSGTSMSSPQVAGAAALLVQLDPTRSPASVKSALMTTAVPAMRKEDGKSPAGPFDMGSGRIDPTRAADAGLVLEAGLDDYLGYLKWLNPSLVDGKAVPLPASDLNLPAISFHSFTGTVLTRRTFTSIDRSSGAWQASLEGMAGIVTAVVPPVFTIDPGRSQTLSLGFSLAGAPLGSYAFGAVVLTNRTDGRTVRIPVSIRPERPAILPLTGL